MVFGWWRSKTRTLSCIFQKNSCGVIRFKSEDALQILVIPTSEDMDYPFTAHGFTAGIKGRIGVPEFTIPRGLGVSIEDGTEIWKITRDGRQTLYAVFENKTFKIVEQ